MGGGRRVDLALVALARRVPWRSVPWGTALVVAGLAVSVTAMAEHTTFASHLAVGPLWLQVLVSAGATNLFNNLPAFLLPLHTLPDQPHLAAHLLGVNLGPTLLVTGSLSGLLWLDAVRRCGLDVGWRHYLRVGLAAGVPALLAATAVVALTW